MTRYQCLLKLLEQGDLNKEEIFAIMGGSRVAVGGVLSVALFHGKIYKARTSGEIRYYLA